MSDLANANLLPVDGEGKFTLQDFLDEYEKGSQASIDLDPRIDFTKPVYEQVMQLRKDDKAACLEDCL